MSRVTGAIPLAFFSISPSVSLLKQNLPVDRRLRPRQRRRIISVLSVPPEFPVKAPSLAQAESSYPVLARAQSTLPASSPAAFSLRIQPNDPNVGANERIGSAIAC